MKTIQQHLITISEDLDSTNSKQYELEGGRKQECKLLEKESQTIEPLTPKQVGEEMVKIEHELKKIKRTDFPIFLDPKTASFLDVAIHAKIRQYLSDSTIEKNLRYARFMEMHPVPINFRKLTPEQFIRHMDYRIEIENATPHALAHERKVIMMFLRAFGISDENWKIICKTPPIIISEDVEVPFPTTVHEFFTYKYSKNKYESRLLQSVAFMGFMFGMRPPSEICNLNLEDLVINNDGTGYLIVHEQKKRGRKRVIVPFNKAVLSSQVYKTPRNYVKYWRHKVANEHSKNALFLQPNGKRVTPQYLREKLSPAGKKIAGQFFHLYTMRHTYATYLYNYTKDINLVSKALGHTKLTNTTKYIHVAEWMQQQVGGNLFNHALKPHNVIKSVCGRIAKNRLVQKRGSN